MLHEPFDQQLKRIMGLISTDPNIDVDFRRVMQSEEDGAHERLMEAKTDAYWEQRAKQESENEPTP